MAIAGGVGTKGKLDRLEAAFVDFVRVYGVRYGARVAYCDSAEPTLIQQAPPARGSGCP